MAARALDWLPGFRFKVTGLGGGIEAHFQSVSGLSMQIEPVAQPEGGENTYVHQLKGKATYGNVTLKRGVTTSATFFNWMKKHIQSPSWGARATVTIIAMNEKGEPKHQWILKEAWPTKWEGGSFDTSSSTALIETLELVHHGFQ